MEPWPLGVCLWGCKAVFPCQRNSTATASESNDRYHVYKCSDLWPIKVVVGLQVTVDREVSVDAVLGRRWWLGDDATMDKSGKTRLHRLAVSSRVVPPMT